MCFHQDCAKPACVQILRILEENNPNKRWSVEVHYLVDDVVTAVIHFAAQGCHVLVPLLMLQLGNVL